MYKPHIATFNGCHNRSKSLTLMVLFLAQLNGEHRGLQHKEIVKRAKIPYSSTRLCQLIRWGYIQRRMGRMDSGHPGYLYSIAMRGKRFVEERIPPERYEEYLEEMNS